MKIKIILSLLISWIIIIHQACQKDTCNDEVTFNNVSSTLETDTTDISLKLMWDQGKALPDSYYSDFMLYKPLVDRYGEAIQNDFNLIDTITNVNAQGMTIKMVSDVVQSIPRSISIHLVFPDRETYIDCQHPGSSDDYFFDFQFNLVEIQDSILMEDFRWEETFFPGPF